MFGAITSVVLISTHSASSCDKGAVMPQPSPAHNIIPMMGECFTGILVTRVTTAPPSLERYNHLFVIPITSVTMEHTIDERTGYQSLDRAIN